MLYEDNLYFDYLIKLFRFHDLQVVTKLNKNVSF